MKRLKQDVYQILAGDDFDSRQKDLLLTPGRRVINPLFGFLLHPEPAIRWRAVVAMGLVVSRMADQEPESARVAIRRMMWQLNDESGGIGWGCPEALGECIARNASLAASYHRILISYLDPDGNYLEHPLLQRGLLWGVGRAAQRRPYPAADWCLLLTPHFRATDPHLRGLAAWAAGAAGDTALLPALRRLEQEEERFSFFDGSRLTNPAIKEVAAAAMIRLGG